MIGPGDPPPASGSTPTALVTDLRRSIEFYAYLGFEVKGRLEAEGDPTWAWLATEGAELMLNRAASPFEAGPEVVVELYARDLVRLRAQLEAAGLSVESAPSGRSRAPALTLRDPDGHRILVSERD